MSTWTRFEKEATGNSEMSYCVEFSGAMHVFPSPFISSFCYHYVIFVITFKRQKRQKYQHLYEKLHASHSAREQEVADLKFTLQQTQQGILYTRNLH